MALTAKQEQELHLDTKAVVKEFKCSQRKKMKFARKKARGLFRSCRFDLIRNNLDQFETNYSNLRNWIEQLRSLGGSIPQRWNRRLSKLQGLFQCHVREIESELLKIDDGGRRSAGHYGNAGDCVIRGLSIATGIAYQQIWDHFDAESADYKSPDNGNSDSITIPYLKSLGWEIEPYPLPYGQTVAEVAKEGRMAIICCSSLDMYHVTTVKNGQIHDTWNCGYFKVVWIAYPPNDEA